MERQSGKHPYFKDAPLLEEDKSWYKFRCNTALALIAIYGGLYSFPNLALSFFFKDDLGLSESMLSVVQSILELVWVFKPVIGWVADSFDIFGSHTKSYLILSGILTSLMWICFGTIVEGLGGSIVCKLIVNIGVNLSTVVGEGIMVKYTKRAGNDVDRVEAEMQVIRSESVAHLETGDERAEAKTAVVKKEAKSNVSIFLSLSFVAQLFSAYLGGTLLNYLDPEQMFYISAGIPIFIVVAGFVIPEDIAANKADKCRRLAAGTSTKDNAKKNIATVWNALKNKDIFLPILYLFFVALTPGVATPMFYY